MGARSRSNGVRGPTAAVVLVATYHRSIRSGSGGAGVERPSYRSRGSTGDAATIVTKSVGRIKVGEKLWRSRDRATQCPQTRTEGLSLGQPTMADAVAAATDITTTVEVKEASAAVTEAIAALH